MNFEIECFFLNLIWNRSTITQSETEFNVIGTLQECNEWVVIIKYK